ncbi:MAG: hypothetical protein ABJB69_09585 [Spartobacteria bacterium]
MDEFSYLSVLLSIIIGLAVTEILQGFRQRLLAHGRVRSYWPSRLWAATLLLVCAQTWWAMFGLRARHDWNFDQFLVLLTQTIVLYLICGLVFPDFPENETVDLREHYFRQRKRFFAFVLAAALISVGRDLVFNHALPERANLIFHGIYAVSAIIAILTANEWYHKALALFIAAAFVNYITTLFVRLQ